VQDLDALGRTRTVGEVVAFLSALTPQLPRASLAQPVVLPAPELSHASFATPAAVPAAATPNVLAKTMTTRSMPDALTVVYRIMADKTGYDVSMIGEEMDLEADLGIDSIKRVEILGAAQEMLGVKVLDLDALGRTRTVGEVVVFLSMLSQTHGETRRGPGAAVTEGPLAPAPLDAEGVIMAIISDTTGYESDMVCADMDLESDLGIGNIKRVQILAAAQEALGIRVGDLDALGRTRTVEEVIAFLRHEMEGAREACVQAAPPYNAGPWAEVSHAATDVPPAPEPPRMPSAQLVGLPAPQLPHASPARPAALPATTPYVPATALTMRRTPDTLSVLYHVMADKTCYDVSMIGEEMDPEADLGIDGTKRVEIFGAAQESLGVEAQDLDALGRTRTVGEAVAFLSSLTQRRGKPQRGPLVAVREDPLSHAPRDAIGAVMQISCKKTGYKSDMVSAEIKLESDLGMDSIERVEILGAVPEALEVIVRDLDDLRPTKTVGKVIASLRREMEEARKAPVETAPPYEVCSRAEVSDTTTNVSLAPGLPSMSPAQLAGLLAPELTHVSLAQPASLPATTPYMLATALTTCCTPDALTVVDRVIVDATGYDVSVIGEEMDLEVVLGMDSIKRMKALGAAQEIPALKLQDLDALRRARTVGDAVAFLNVLTQLCREPQLGPGVAVTEEPLALAPCDAVGTLMALISDKAGFEPNMASAEMDLESDLGIDSAERVEILVATDEALRIMVGDLDALGRTKTIEGVREAQTALCEAGPNCLQH